MLELDRGRGNRVVEDRVTENLPGSRATYNSGSFEVVAKLIHRLTCLNQWSGAENEYRHITFNFAAWQIRLPSFTL
jgi:hypothetical protein